MSKLFVVAICALVAAAVAKPNPPGCGPPPNSKNPSECCDVPLIFDKAQMEPCIAKHGKPQQGPPMHGGGGHDGGLNCCLAECAFNVTKAVTNGNIDAAALKSFVKGRLNGANDWQSVLDKAIDECLSESAQKMSSPMPAGGPTPPPGGEQCDPKYGFVMMCVQHKAFYNCPAAIYKASPECDELKKMAQNCPLHLKMDG